eukprot:TRINITY_DN12867_c0_g1_i1.p1 TRINITY_DN12867_c0_g1~~TRINITY_DN12867_c0_g1_i1.p1  ORF type:complete len:1029 (+),score=222.97 TRINITY_DN12867_c0_g1_i1:180-3089(+)
MATDSSQPILEKEIVRSAYDQRDYRHITLPNELQSLLISDPTTDRAAAALDVNVGHFMDPEDIPGLAHFCEHMLFLGTTKYPEEGSYQAFVSQHGGITNAFTSMENTQYYFEITKEHLGGALDMFSQFFIAPLFTESGTNREMNAVDSENTKNLQSDDRRFFSLLKSCANEAHPFHKFGTGNLQTLSVPRIRQALLDFHSKYYSSNRMKLCVLGKESLDELEEMAREKFSSIENKNVPAPSWDTLAFTDNELKKIFHIVPVKQENRLELMWPLPCQQEFYEVKPTRYLGHVLGHEGPGSLLSFLKSKGWVDELSAGVGRSQWANGVLFSVSLILTEEGKDAVPQITKSVYQYLRLMRERGVQQWIYSEIANEAELRFRFQDKSEPTTTVSTHVAHMQDGFPPNQIISGPSLLLRYDERLIHDTLALLRPDNMLVHFSSPSLAGSTDQVERWYQIDYRVEEITAAQIADWSDPPVEPALQILQPNPFIATKFDLKEPDRELSEFPVLLEETPISRLWYKLDRTFKRPKAAFGCKLNNIRAYDTPLNAAMTKLFSLLVFDTLQEFSYDAEIAGLTYQLVNVQCGLQFWVRGYDHKLAVLLKAVAGKMANFKVDDERFELVKRSMIRDYEHWNQDQPYQHAMYYNGFLVEQARHHVSDQKEAAETITLPQLQQFVHELFANLHMEAYVHGNFTAAEAKRLMADLIESLKPAPLQPGQYFEQAVVQIPDGSRYVFQIPEANPQNENSACTVSYQIGQYTPEMMVRLDLVARIASEPLFSQLRTKEQLGYIVHVGSRHANCAVEELMFLVQSDKQDPVYLHARICDWVAKFVTHLEELPQDKFDAFVQALITLRLEKPKRMSQEVSRYWDEISERTYVFDKREREAAALQALTLPDVVEFFKKHIAGPQARQLAIQVFGNRHPIRALSAFTPAEVAPEAGTLSVTELSAESVPTHSSLKKSLSSFYRCIASAKQ